MKGHVYVNPDFLARDEFVGWNAPDADLNAAIRKITASVQHYNILGLDFLIPKAAYFFRIPASFTIPRSFTSA